MQQKKQESAFSLVEMSVVVVIIALLAGTVVGGAKVIRNAKLRAMMAEFEEHKSVITRFKETFKFLPGDYPKAESYWSGTTNGDGDWIINESGSNEDLLFWQHLYLAKYIAPAYTGATSGARYERGVNAPESAFSGGMFVIRNFSSDIYDTDGNLIQFGGLSSDGWNNAPLLSAKDVYYVETKIDDDNPSEGNLYAYRPSGTACVDADSSASSADYNFATDETVANCLLVWWLNKE